MQTPEKVTAMAMQARSDPEALLQLWQGCSRYAYKVTMIYQKAAALNGAVDMDDLRQCAFLGFYEAVQGFDHLRGDFLTLLSYCVRNECRKLLGLTGRERKEHYTTTSIDAPIPGSEDITLADTIPDTAAALPFEQAEMRRDIDKALHRLPDDMERIIRMHDLDGMTFDACAECLECPSERVKNRRQMAFRRLRADEGVRQYHAPVRLRYKGYNAWSIDWMSVVEEEVIRRLDK